MGSGFKIQDRVNGITGSGLQTEFTNPLIFPHSSMSRGCEATLRKIGKIENRGNYKLGTATIFYT